MKYIHSGPGAVSVGINDTNVAKFSVDVLVVKGLRWDTEADMHNIVFFEVTYGGHGDKESRIVQ